MKIEAKVGIISLIAILLFFFFMGRITKYSSTETFYTVNVLFKNVGGLVQGASVRVAGVKLGRVEKITLTPNGMVMVNMKLNQGVTLKEDYAFSVNGTIMGDMWIEITPQVDSKAKVVPHNEEKPVNVVVKEPVAIDDLVKKTGVALEDMRGAIKQVNKALNSFDTVAKSLNEAVKDVRRITNDETLTSSIKQTVENLSKASKDVVALTSHLDRVGQQLDKVDVVTPQKQVGRILSNVETTTTTVKKLANRNEKNIDDIVKNLKESATSLKNTMKAIEDVIASGKTKKELTETITNIRVASEQVQKVAKGLNELVNDEKLKKEIRETIVQAKEAAENANKVLSATNKVVETLGGGPKIKTSVDLRLLNRGKGWQADTFVSFDKHKKQFVLLGVSDIGHTNKLSLQLGRNVSSTQTQRFGLFYSQVGFATDYKLGKNFTFSYEIYNIRDLQVDFLTHYNLGNDFSLILGINDVFDRYRKGIFGLNKSL